LKMALNTINTDRQFRIFRIQTSWQYIVWFNDSL
jgi:hypothetical protein